MPRKPNTESRRQEIVNAMLPVLATHGYEKATIQLIAKEAGLTPGLIHYHFASKRDILLELVKSLAGQALERYQGQPLADANPHERLSAYVKARLAYGEGESPEAVAAWVIIGAEAVRQTEVREIYQRVIAMELALVQGLLRDCLVASGKSTANVERLGAAVIALVEGAFQMASAAGAVMPRDYAAGMAQQLLERFLSAEPSA